MKLLFLDIETSPHIVYCWGLWNQNIAINQIQESGYTLCWAAKWYGKDEVMFASLHHNGAQDMLQQVWQLLDEADAVVHFNGTKFDMPRLMQEFLQAGMKPPSPVAEIDLYRTVKKRFAFPSNKLSYILNTLGMEGKLAHKGMDLWKECMEGNEEAWNIMRKYNKQDVVALEPLYEELKPWIVSHPNHNLYTAEQRPVCPNCGSVHVEKRGTYPAKTQVYQRYNCKNCGKWFRNRTSILAKEKRANVMVGIE